MPGAVAQQEVDRELPIVDGRHSSSVSGIAVIF
jgi:hypothetical protein